MNKKVIFAAVMLAAVLAVVHAGTGTAVSGGEFAFQLPYNGFDISRVKDVPTASDGFSSESIQNITFKNNIAVTDALQFLSVKYHKNIVPSPEVTGRLAFNNLFNVTFEEALEAILGDKYRYQQEGQLIRVYSKDEYQNIKDSTSRMIYRVFALSYIDSEEAKKMVIPVMSSNGKVQSSTAAEAGVPTGASISSSVGGGNSVALNDMLIVYDYPEHIAEVEKVINSIDKRPRQVLVEATILSANLTEGMELGIDLNMMGGTHLETTDDATVMNQLGGHIPGADALFETSGFASVGGSGMRIGVTAGNIQAFITALEAVTDITLLANPRILAVNKQLGQVYIGNKLGYREGDVETAAGGTQQGEVKFLDTGTKLAFRPYIGNDGYIRMDIHPKDSSGSLNDQGVPNEDSAELATNIMVKDGETIVIGGLFRELVTSVENKVPLLGDIPLAGALFRNVSDTVRRQEVIVLLTPHIVDEPSDLDTKQALDDVSMKTKAAVSGLHYPGSSRLAEDFYADAVKYYVKGESSRALKKLEWSLRFRPGYLDALKLREKIRGSSSYAD